MFCDGEIDLKDKCYCSKCYYKLPYLDDNRCLICGRELASDIGYQICPTCQKHKMYIDVNYPTFMYDELMKDALLRYKFCGRMWYYKSFSEFMYNTLKDKNIKADYIVYPPINVNTFYKRGFNQAELLAKELSNKMEIKLLKNAILKKYENNKQSLMSATDRFKNVKDLFKINKKYNDLFTDKKVLFIDDILTTGATASECSKILKDAGAKFVYCSTLCITR